MQMNEFQQFILINILYNFIKIFICKKRGKHTHAHSIYY